MSNAALKLVTPEVDTRPKVRHATMGDMAGIFEVSQDLLEQSVYSDLEMDKPVYRRLISDCINSKKAIAMVVVDGNNDVQGFLFGIVDQIFFTKLKYATDIVTYVKPQYAAQSPIIVKRFIAWGKKWPSVRKIMMGISSGMDTDGRTGQMYERLGLECVGGIYMMAVSAKNSQEGS